VVPLGAFAFVAWQDWLAVMSESERDVSQTADTEREHALNVLETDQLIIRLVDERIRSMSWDEIASSRPLHEYLGDLRLHYPQLQAIGIVDANGFVRSSSLAFPVRSVQESTRWDFFQKARNGAEGLIIGAVRPGGTRLPEPHFALARRRSSAEGQFDGVIVVSMLPRFFADVWQQNWHDSPGQVTTLVRGDLKVLARVPPAALDHLDPASQIVTDMRRGVEAIVRNVSSIDGIDRLVTYRRVPGFDVLIISGQNVAVLRAHWYQHLLAYGTIFAAVILALTSMALTATRHMQNERHAVRQWREAIDELSREADRRHLTERQLAQAEKLEALGKVTGGFAHDFGNILSAIKLNLDCLRGRLTNDEDEKILDDSINEAELGAQAVRSLLTFARHESLERDTIDLSVVLPRAETLLRQAVGSISDLHLDVEPGTWRVTANTNQLELALLNLAVNARDAMPDGGRMRLATRNVVLNGAPEGLIGEFVAVSLSDTGSGMPPDVVARAIEPFFTTKAEGSGTGLGLSQVYGFAKERGGTIVIESALGRGTTVTIYLPKDAEADEPSDAADTPNLIANSEFGRRPTAA
jgi:signal transduction histidine kinase